MMAYEFALLAAAKEKPISMSPISQVPSYGETVVDRYSVFKWRHKLLHHLIC